MKTFPKCQTLQEHACDALRNMASCSSAGKKRIIELGGIEVLLAAVINHLDSEILCQSACWAMYNIISDDKERTELLLSLGGGAVVAKVSRYLTAEMTIFQPTVRSSRKSSDSTIACPEVLAFSSQPTALKVATGSSKMAALSSQPVAPEETTTSPNNPTLSSQATLVGVDLESESSDGISPSSKVPTVSF
jgi:hypothetical protein